MARALAEEFETVGRIRLRSPAQEKAAHAALLDLGWSYSPRVEDTASDTIVIDLHGLSELFGSEESIANQLVQRATALGLSANVAIASDLQVAIHAAHGFSGSTWIAPLEESRRLACLPVSVLAPSAETAETLANWGVHTCGGLAALPALSLSERLGQEGVQLHEWARGAGVRSMVLAEPGMCFEEGIELDDSVEDLEPLAFLLNRLLHQLSARLKARSLAFLAIHLRFHLDLSGKVDRQVRIDHPRETNQSRCLRKNANAASLANARFGRCFLNLLRLKLQEDPPSSPVFKILMIAEPSRPRAIQAGLFLPAFPDPEKLELTIAKLAHLVGHSNIGSPQLVDTHRPGAFSMQRFVPSREEPKMFARRAKAAFTAVKKEKTKRQKDAKPVIGFRMFRPPLPANVQLSETVLSASVFMACVAKSQPFPGLGVLPAIGGTMRPGIRTSGISRSVSSFRLTA